MTTIIAYVLAFGVPLLALLLPGWSGAAGLLAAASAIAGMIVQVAQARPPSP